VGTARGALAHPTLALGDTIAPKGSRAMSDGDILQIQLWIGAAAITTSAVGMTAAKWEHKYFIWSMFGLSALLATTALFWRQISPLLPTNGSEFIGWLARTPYGWFALFTVGIVAIVAIARIQIALSDLDERFPEMEKRLQRIYDQRFINQTVLLDGKHFLNATLRM
jgi:hypothetical protein